MIKILDTLQIRELDAYTIRHEPVASIDLMERACRAFCSWFANRFDPSKRIGVVCGTGNNGGDGLGIARMLRAWDYPVNVWVVQGGAAESEDFRINLARLKGKADIAYLTKDVNGSLFSACDVLVDAIFGSGLSRPPEGLYAEVIEQVNQCNAVRVAVDVPSGLQVDKPSTGTIIKAHYTVSFQLPKLSFFFPSCHEYVGEWCTVDIGLSKAAIDAAPTKHFLLTKKSVASLIRPLGKFDHKGNHGKALLIAGSYGKMGAAILAARGALRTGIGLITLHVPKLGYAIVQAAVPEAMADIDESEFEFTSPPALTSCHTIGIGPGIGQSKKTVKALGVLLAKFGKPVVLDADALNCISSNPELLKAVPKNSILTPHPREFERIAGAWQDDFERLNRQAEWSASHSVVVVLKGAHTSITSPDGKVFFNDTGNPGMATGGTGDVLTGVLTALLAGGYPPLDAAQLGVWLHGLAGDVAAQARGIRGLIASDVIDHLGEAFRRLG